MKFQRSWLLCAVALAAAIGCSSAASVNGSVTLDDKPLTTGEVTFHPQGGGSLPLGAIQNGKYSLSTGQSEQVEPGVYKVTVKAMEATAEMTKDANGNPVYATPKLLTPAKYDDPKTSPFEFTVKRGSNRIDLPLKSQ